MRLGAVLMQLDAAKHDCTAVSCAAAFGGADGFAGSSTSTSTRRTRPGCAPAPPPPPRCVARGLSMCLFCAALECPAPLVAGGTWESTADGLGGQAAEEQAVLRELGERDLVLRRRTPRVALSVAAARRVSRSAWRRLRAAS